MLLAHKEYKISVSEISYVSCLEESSITEPQNKYLFLVFIKCVTRAQNQYITHLMYHYHIVLNLLDIYN